MAAKIPSKVAKPIVPASLDGNHASQERGKAIVAVRITRRSTRLLDVDNSYASIKFILDGLCDCGLIPGDGPKDIQLEVVQEKVRSKDQAGVQIEIVSQD